MTVSSIWFLMIRKDFKNCVYLYLLLIPNVVCKNIIWNNLYLSVVIYNHFVLTQETCFVIVHAKKNFSHFIINLYDRRNFQCALTWNPLFFFSRFKFVRVKKKTIYTIVHSHWLFSQSENKIRIKCFYSKYNGDLCILNDKWTFGWLSREHFDWLMSVYILCYCQ